MNNIVREEEKKAEEDIARMLEEKCNCEVYLQNRYSQFDLIGIKEKEPIFFAEVRTRSVEKNKYPDFMIALSKIIAAEQLSSITNLPCMLFVRWNDKTGICFLTRISKGEMLRVPIESISMSEDWSKTRKGQTYREVMAHISIEEFKDV
jgi:hypothetical protein